VKKKCVTLAGDVVDPAGLMTGGSSGNLGTTLRKLSMLTEAAAELEAKEAELAELTSQVGGGSSN